MPFPGSSGEVVSWSGTRERSAAGGRYRERMPNEDTAPIPVQPTAARPGTRAVAFLAAAGVLLIVSTFTNLITLPSSTGESLAAINGWGLDLGLGHTIQQYIGVVALIAGVALILIAAASLRPGFGWTRNASLVAGGLGVGAGLFLAAAGYSTGTFLAEIAGVSGQDVAPLIGPGIWLALLGSACALVAISSPVRVDTVAAAPVVEEQDEAVVYRVDEESQEEETR